MTENIYQKTADILQSLYPETSCFLHYQAEYQLLFAVILSAQTTDIKVNQVTPVLFERYPDLVSLSNADVNDIKEIIKTLGLANSKAGYVKKTARILVEKYDGQVPKDRDELMSLPGVGYKTSGVVLAELYNYPYIPVDTHVKRVSQRIGLVPEGTNPDDTEKMLEKGFEGKTSIQIHRQLILFGRNICVAQKPKCKNCPMKTFCRFCETISPGNN